MAGQQNQPEMGALVFLDFVLNGKLSPALWFVARIPYLKILSWEIFLTLFAQAL